MAVAGIRDSLKERGVRLTRQRQILLDLIDQIGSAPGCRTAVSDGEGEGPEAEPGHGLSHAEDAEGAAAWSMNST